MHPIGTIPRPILGTTHADQDQLRFVHAQTGLSPHRQSAASSHLNFDDDSGAPASPSSSTFTFHSRCSFLDNKPHYCHPLVFADVLILLPSSKHHSDASIPFSWLVLPTFHSFLDRVSIYLFFNHRSLSALANCLLSHHSLKLSLHQVPLASTCESDFLYTFSLHFDRLFSARYKMASPEPETVPVVKDDTIEMSATNSMPEVVADPKIADALAPVDAASEEKVNDAGSEDNDGEGDDGDGTVELDIDATPSTLLDLLTTASIAYAKRSYTTAADLYSTSAAVQDILYGEMKPTNAEVLFLYGQALFKVAVENSDVLGGKTAEQALAGGIPGAGRVGDLVEPIRGGDKGKGKETGQFHFSDGDEDDEEEDDDVDGEDGEAEAEGDDFADAYEMLEVSRVLFEKVAETGPDEKLDENVAFSAALAHVAKGQADKAGLKATDKGKQTAPTSGTAAPVDPVILSRYVKSRLAMIHDYQAEILLESEQFHNAITEFETLVRLREELEPEESNLVAEGRYKLALAMEFASLDEIRKAQQAADAGGDEGEEPKLKGENGEGSSSDAAATATTTGERSKSEPKVDEALRSRAAEMMQRAVNSCRLRVEIEQGRLDKDAAAAATADGTTSGLDRDALEREIADVKEMIAEMEQRVEDLKNPVDLSATTTTSPSMMMNPADGLEQMMAGGIDLAAIMGAISGQAGKGSSSKKGGVAADAEVRDISNLIKVKRKRDGDHADEGSDSKKSKN